MALTYYRTFDSPIGILTLAGEGDSLTNLVLEDVAHPPDDRRGWVEDPTAFCEVAEQLHDYFAGERTEFDVAVRPAGTDFQRVVWDALKKIPYGETRSYGDIASAIGRPGASRAVGLANGRNPIAIIIACHRVIGADGSLTGYGGGLKVKQALLDLERGVAAKRPRCTGATRASTPEARRLLRTSAG